MVAIDHEGCLRSTRDDQLAPSALDQVYAVLVLWRDKEASPWVGWITTTTRCATCFSDADLQDPMVLGWLMGLAGWDPRKLSFATTTPGLHLVWRR